MPVRNYELECASGRLAIRHWGTNPQYVSGNKLPIIGLHGWLDNAGTFKRLAGLVENDGQQQLIAPDFPGHGLSQWRSRDAGYYIWAYVRDLLELLDSLQIEKARLLGHSMGGAVATLAASCFPDRIDSIILLDSVGPLITPAERAPGQLRRSLQQLAGLERYAPRVYESREAAIASRARKGLSLEAAGILAERGLREQSGGFIWGHDPRLTQANLLSLTGPQADAFLSAILCPTYLISCKSFWHDMQDFYDSRVKLLSATGRLEIHQLDGSHHQHLEEETAGRVAALVKQIIC